MHDLNPRSSLSFGNRYPDIKLWLYMYLPKLLSIAGDC